jgi:phosphoglycolate phosphatase
VAARPFDLLVFDWDGTLADSAAQIVEGMQQAIATLSLPARTDAQIRDLIGLGFSDAIARLYPEFAPEDVLQQLENYRRLIVAGPRVHGPAEAPLFKEAEATLASLREAGYRLAVATGKSRASLERSFRHHASLRALFSSSRCADETASKPDPLMLRELLEQEDVPPGRALMIGDTEYDVAMARACGMPVLGVACGVHDAGRLAEAGAVDLIGEVRELPGWLAAYGSARPA